MLPRRLSTGGFLLAFVGAVACSDDAPPRPPPAADAGTVADAGTARDAGFVVTTTATLELMTWNVENFPKSTNTATVVATLIETLAPDLLGIQELRDPRAFDAMLETLPDYDGAWVFDEFISVGIVYRKDRLRVRNITALFERDEWAFPRPPLQAEVEVIGPDGQVRFDFIFINVHLKARGDERSQSRRFDAIETLEEYIGDRIDAGGEPDYVVLGDYNDRLLDEDDDNVFAPMLRRPERYTFLTQALEARGDTSYIPFPGFIDHIMITNDALDEYGNGYVEAIAAEAMWPWYESIVSDHRPVRAVFELP